MIDLALRQRIAESLLGGALDADGYAPCPGKAKHSNRDGRRDFKVWLDGAPSGKCVHDSCAAEVDAFNADLRRRIGAAESGGNGCPHPSPLGAVAPLPVPPRGPKRPPYDPAALQRVASLCGRAVSCDWLAERSPVPVPPAHEQGIATAGTFMDALYDAGERVLVFTSQLSQGDFVWHAGAGGLRLARERGVEPVASALPDGAAEGVWFLTNPVCGEWRINAHVHTANGLPRWGRRHGECVASWRYLLLESDSAPDALWLRALLVLPLPIAAIYTSGGRSLHALVRLDAGGKLEWDARRDELLPLLCSLGADGAAMSAVRLSRLPGCLRHGKRAKDGSLQRYERPALQRLIYLNPRPPIDAAILDFIK
ncbi:hypothetical protein [Prosthecobacter sp.]|uniref:hypothetical protein n=1 Tax=Prosthecobacter sp. TaxID=1965333 RepID=UPI002ABB7E56|nr:hypothetical protein [Prosthecobacter sp.]MDZ4403078.1 hypothetical protein [Prosthecobacter sp.]